MNALLALVAILSLAACATNVPASRQQQVAQANSTGYYSYQLHSSSQRR